VRTPERDKDRAEDARERTTRREERDRELDQARAEAVREQDRRKAADKLAEKRREILDRYYEKVRHVLTQTSEVWLERRSGQPPTMAQPARSGCAASNFRTSAAASAGVSRWFTTSTTSRPG
jgi:hypothetical protein